MSLGKIRLIGICLLSGSAMAAESDGDIARQLGWVQSPSNFCGGYYLSEPLIFPLGNKEDDTVSITSNCGLLSQKSTSTLEGGVTVTRGAQQLTANKAYLYRDPATGKLYYIDMIGNVNLRENSSLVVARNGRYYFDNKAKSLFDIVYRTPIDGSKIAKQKSIGTVTELIANGRAKEFSQKKPLVYDLTQASYSTCPPLNPAWRVKASHIVLDKNSGRGYATHARIEVKDIPVFYFPYINFPIDKTRKTGFLWPLMGSSNKWGPYLQTPYYWNMAPNYDMTITPGILSKRGFLLTDNFRYLSPTSEGNLYFGLLPNDQAFREWQQSASINPLFTNPVQFPTPGQTASVTQAEFNRLLDSSTTRRSFVWRDNSRYNEHWSSHVDFNYAGDDYYLQDFGRTLNEITANQLLQEGDLYYNSQNWNFTGRVQTYQTLHPLKEAPVLNQYRRFPQLILNGDYPDQKFGLEYFVNSEVTHFSILNTPGSEVTMPIGNRLHLQPGISLPIYQPSFFINPRIQLAMTDYNLYQTSDTNTPGNKKRTLPIADIFAGLSLERSTALFGHAFQQTLEPQVYYTYIPYRNQASIPIFDTTVNTLTYEQIFNYNRFTGIDRIGDANQLGWGITTRLIDQESGFEKVRLGVGNIIYFANRRVTLCNDKTICNDNPDNPSNEYSLSPLSGVLNYHINPAWSFNATAIWDPISKQLANSTIAFQYRPDEARLLNIGYSYARNGDILSGIATNTSIDNLKVTDLSLAWPVFNHVSVVGRWAENWNRVHLQNLLFGLQYDTCCYAVQLVGGRAFTGFDPEQNYEPKYNNEVSVQFSLKGLGDFATGNPSGLLSGIPGYRV